MKKKLKTGGISLVLFLIFLMGLFAETVRTLPVGASNEYYREFFDIPKLSFDIYDDKLAKTFLIKKVPKIDNKTKETLVSKEEILIETKEIIEKKNEDKIIKEDVVISFQFLSSDVQVVVAAFHEATEVGSTCVPYPINPKFGISRSVNVLFTQL